MEGFEIKYNNKLLSIASIDELLIINIINIINKETSMYVGSVDFKTKKRNITPIDLDAEFEIKLTGIEKVDPPIRSTIDVNIKRPISKLESFYKLETLLKEEGLL